MAVGSQDTDSLYFILYPSGSHGSFLKLLLNTMIGNSVDKIDDTVYHMLTYSKPSIFDATHTIKTSVDPSQVINVRVDPSSYLKYFAVCLNRTAGKHILIEDLTTNTFEKINQHPIVSFFADSLSVIAGRTVGDVEPKYLREWFRLCFFANNGDTITKFILPNVLDNSKYTIDFESFYNGTILDQCKKICNDLELTISNEDQIKEYLSQFVKNNTYYSIDQGIPDILDAIGQPNSVDLANTNILQQAWIDNYLVTKYNINPLLKNDYFSNTAELTKAYGI
jgi:hypothetical protein